MRVLQMERPLQDLRLHLQHRGHEVRVARLAGEPVERLHHFVAVVGTDGPDPHVSPIAERDLDRLE